MLYHPRLDEETGFFCEEFVKSEKENYKSIILSQINEPRTYAAIRCREEMFKSLGIVDNLDTMCERIDSVSVSDLYDCYKEIISNAKIFVFYVGNRPIDSVKKLVGEAFPSHNTYDFDNDKPIKLLENLEEHNEVIESSEISQGRLIMGFNCQTTWRDKDYYATLLCNEILGASPISKLMMNVREKLSLCYECSSVYNSARGAIFVTTGIDSENYELAKSAIIAQLDEIKQGKISSKEFEAAKKSIFNVYSAICDSPNAIERFYLGRIINEIDVDVVDFLKIIEKITVEDVIKAAQRLSLHTVYFLQGDEEGEEIYE
jgi:predicted Zn-dependent peptidase